MQPTFLPWIGYFALIDRVDEFILLDHVQFAHRSWQQRNRIKTPHGVQWLTLPVEVKGKRDQRILDVRIGPTSDFAEKIERAITLNYSRAPWFARYSEAVLGPLARRPQLLVDVTIPLIWSLCRAIGVDTPIVRSSELEASGRREGLLVEICRSRGATTYVSPRGSHAYLDGSSAFPDAGIELRYHDYEHPTYPQLWGEFVPYLSTIDLLFNAGPDTLSVIRSGIR
jgi:hypothetical protein